VSTHWQRQSERRLPARRAGSRGLTLLEVLIVVLIIALLVGAVLLGPGALRSSQVRGAATLIVSAVRLAGARANTTGRPARLVFDFDEKRLLLEEAVGSHFARSKTDVAGGAEAATDLEKAAREESERVLEGPRAPRQEFVPVPVLTDPDDPTKGRAFGSGVLLARMQTEHDDEPITSGRGYLYFWPGGLTEHAAIHLKRLGGSDEGITVMIKALTGRASVERGRVDLELPRLDEDTEGLSEREED
jgi:general secretion pathway protein H